MFSFLIPTRNRYDVLKQCVDAILESDDYPQGAEIIVVDNSDHPEERAIRAIRERVSGRLVFKYAAFPKDVSNNANLIRNHALRLATNEYLVLLDDDAFIRTRGWTKPALACLDDEKVAGLTGVIEEPGKDVIDVPAENRTTGVIDSRGRCLGNFFQRPAGIIQVDHMRGCFMMMKKSRLEEAGGFDEDLTDLYFDETDVCLRLGRNGFTLLLTPEIHVYHGMAPRDGFISRDEERGSVMYCKIRNTVYVYLKVGLRGKIIPFLAAETYDNLYHLARKGRWIRLKRLFLTPFAALAGTALFVKHRIKSWR